MARTGRPRKYANKTEEAEGNRKRVQQHRQRQKLEKGTDISETNNVNKKKNEVSLDDTWQAEKTSVVKETHYCISRSGLQQPIMSPPLPYLSLPLPTLPSSSASPSPHPLHSLHSRFQSSPMHASHVPAEQDNNIQKVIDDFSAIRLYSTSPIKQLETFITQLPQRIQSEHTIRQQLTRGDEDVDWRYMEYENEKEEEEEGGYRSETIRVRPKPSMRVQVEIPVKRKQKNRKEKGKEKEIDKMTLV
ncbi:MAG: hypothetical protein M1840_001799 [Geoglossum simile]|nr:MAG: hypothetical protein M1840_001799 [Geoglossum simile]